MSQLYAVCEIQRAIQVKFKATSGSPMLLSMLNGHSTLTKHILYFFGLRWLHWNFPGVLLSLESQVKIFAPNIEQRDVVNHLKGSPTEEKRNVLVESARLARGNIQDLAELKASEFDAVIFPGGFGVAKNLCSWAVDGKNCTVNEHVNSTLQAFHSAKKPIGLCCISPVLAAKVFPGCEVTVGQDKNVDGRFPDAETASAIAELGCKHICKNVNESHVDKANKIVTTCAFMCKAPLHEIFDGIGTMVQEVLKLA
ncbi:glutamine amidotransferase-like class 1 domain-containing protein 3, mitochondrial isoform X1 [Gymnogyps californianus]|nr:glutamine amidotransferase-like class 1 domain-containing protein 3, mitochondrial isoform X1 [Gymnogyps californianus]